MANKKISILMEAVNKFSQPASVMSKSAGQLEGDLKETAKALNALGKKEKQIARFKGLTSRLEDTRAELARNRLETDKLKRSELSAVSVVKDHSRALKKAEESLLEVSGAYGEESEEAQKAQKAVSELTKLKKSASTALKKERSEIKKSTQAGVRLASSYAKQSKELGGLKNDLGKAGIKLNSLGSQELKLAKQTEKANKALKQQGARLKEINTLKGRIDARNAQKGELAGQAMSVTAKLLPLGLAGKRSVEYESIFADVKKVVNFKDDKEEGQYRSQMMKLAGDLGVKQEGIAEIVTAAGQSGIEKDQLLQFASSATKMSVAWDVSAEDAGATLATWRAALGLTQKNALDLADATNYLSNNMNAKAKDIAAVMVRQGSTAMGAGFDANETAALSASLIAGGATEETAATALKNISGALTAGYSASKSKSEAMDRLGYDPEQLASDMQSDAKGTLIGVLKELQGVSDAERGAVISELFGEEIKGAVSKLVTTLNDDKNGLISAFSKVADQADRAGSVNDEYANRAKTRSHNLAQLGAKFDRMTIAIGDRLLPVLDAVLPPLMTAVDTVADFAESSPVITSSLLTAVGAIGVLKAGALAFKAAKIFGGNAFDKRKLSKLSGSTDKTSISANRASRSLDILNNKLNSLGRNAGGYSRGGRGKKGRKSYGKKRSGFSRLLDAENAINAPKVAGSYAAKKRGVGKYGRLAGLLGGGAALSMFSGAASAGGMGLQGGELGDIALAGADIAGAAGSVFEGLPAMAGVLKGAGKLFKPLDIALSGAALTSAISEGDGQQIGSTAGDMAGGLGGAAAGAMAGAALGSVVPVLGTAVGGVIGSIVGGLGGGAAGEWIGGKVGGLFDSESDDKPSALGRFGDWVSGSVSGWLSEDKISSPADTGSAVAQINETSRQGGAIHFAPSIQIAATGNPSYDQDLANQVIERLKAELMPALLSGGAVSSRADAGLVDNKSS